MIQIYNTLTGKKEEFKPVEDGIVRIYTCGPTVYNYIHLGNARPAVVFDVFRRYLEYRGYQVVYVQNFTDIDDKIINRAKELGVDFRKLSEKFIKEYRVDAAKLGIREANFHPKTTDFVNEIIDFIKELIEKGYAYEVDGDVYFSVRKFEKYGELSHRNIDELIAGARIEPGEKKKDPLDFALWKSAKPDEPHWESPWSSGRPGWHIECSVMSTKILGKTFDIHAGGNDLIFPHHENEKAQTEALTGKPFVKYWMHNGMINFKGMKMSKSTGNFVILRESLKAFGKDAIRYFLLSKHYRSPIDASVELLEEAKKATQRVNEALDRIYRTLNKELIIPKNESLWVKEKRSQIIEALDDDFNTPKALGVIFDTIRELNSTDDRDVLEEGYYLIREEFGPIFGLFEAQQEQENVSTQKLDEVLRIIINIRNEFRKNKDFATADRIRDELSNIGINLKDTPNGTEWSMN
ncbi:MAG: cysteinyl-tRNA synthetase [Thermotogaceae bacterium]|nr:cysteinyl-tRNA synthetase [Thermotogaceae bacterium]MDN5337268.1 cysteinyl-tRNA synthetase [Thermotogaceae bacterium]